MLLIGNLIIKSCLAYFFVCWFVLPSLYCDVIFLSWRVFSAVTSKSKQELRLCCLEFYHGCWCQVGSHSGNTCHSHLLPHTWPLLPRYSGTQTDLNWICFLNWSITFLPYLLNVTSVVNSILLFRMLFVMQFLISWDLPSNCSFVQFVSAAVVLCKLFQTFIKALVSSFIFELEYDNLLFITYPCQTFLLFVAIIFGFPLFEFGF